MRVPLSAGQAAATAGTGALVMTATARLVGAAVVLAAAALVWIAARDTTEDGAPVARSAGAATETVGERGRGKAPRSEASPGTDARAAATADDVAAAGTAADPTPSPKTLVTGRVLLPDGSPAKGVAVILSPVYGTRWVATDADGRFVVKAADAGSAARVWVVAPGWRAPAAESIVPRAGETVAIPDVRLLPDTMVRLYGTLRSSRDLPIRRAHVDVTWSASQAEIDAARAARDPSMAAMLLATGDDPAVAGLRYLGAAVADDGTFVLDVPAAAGSVGFKATAEGHLNATREPSRVAALAASPIEIVVRPLPRAHGYVVDGPSGLPIAGARLGFHWAYGSRDVTWLAPPVVTDAAGRFEVAGVPEGGPYLLADAPEYPLWSGEPRRDEELRIEVRRDVTIAGRVVLADGTPVAGATVSTRARIRTGDAHRSVQTDADGRFTLPSIPEGPHAVHVRPPAAVNLQQTLVEEVAAGTSDVLIVLEPGLEISGTVVDEDGKPLDRIGVSASRADGKPLSGATPGSWGSGSGASASTGPDGAFSLLGLGAGAYTVTAGTYQSPGVKRRPARIEGIDAGTVGVRITLRRGATIAGVIVDEDGRPVAGRTVHAIPPRYAPLGGDVRGPSGTTDAEGRFTIGGAEENGTYWLRMEWPYGDPDQRTWLVGGESVRAGSEGLRLVLVDGGVIAGTVVDASGVPVRGEFVWLVRAKDDSSARQGFAAWTDEKGRFEILHVPPGWTYGVVWRQGRADGVSVGTRDVRLVPQK